MVATGDDVDQAANDAASTQDDDAETVRSQPPGLAVIVTGRAGAGRTTAIHALEDLGFETVDTPPLTVAATIARQAAGARAPDDPRGVVIGLDARTIGFSAAAVAKLLAELRAERGIRVEMLFLDGDDETLRRRYTETRRRHPLSGAGGVEEGLRRDRDQMAPIRALADWVLDTSALARHDLARAIRERYGEGEATRLHLTVLSFSYRHGLPADADIVFDCRFLRNPHYEPELRHLDGRDPTVAAYVAQDPRYPAFMAHLAAYPETLLPAYAAEGKSYLTLAFGCTGGQHRSVAVAEAFAKTIAEAGWRPRLSHRAQSARDRDARDRDAREAGAGSDPNRSGSIDTEPDAA